MVQREPNRRGILNATIGAGALISGLSGIASASDSADIDFELTDRSKVSDSRAKSEFARLRSNSNVRSLQNELQAEYDMLSVPETVSGFDVQTDDPEVNESDPTVLFATFGADATHGGFMMAVVDTVENRRQPLSAETIMVEPSADAISGTNSGVNLTSHSIGSDGEVNSVVVEQNYQMQGEGFTAEDIVSCPVCVGVAGWICEKGTGNIGKTRCIGQCMVFGPVGWAACSMTCMLLIDIINDTGCGVGAAVLCAQIGAC